MFYNKDMIELAAWSWVRVGGDLADFDMHRDKLRAAIEAESNRVAGIELAQREMAAAKDAFLRESQP